MTKTPTVEQSTAQTIEDYRARELAAKAEENAVIIAKACVAICTLFLRDFEYVSTVDLNKHWTEWKEYQAATGNNWFCELDDIQQSFGSTLHPSAFDAAVVKIATTFKGLRVLHSFRQGDPSGIVVH